MSVRDACKQKVAALTAGDLRQFLPNITKHLNSTFRVLPVQKTIESASTKSKRAGEQLSIAASDHKRARISTTRSMMAGSGAATKKPNNNATAPKKSPTIKMEAREDDDDLMDQQHLAGTPESSSNLISPSRSDSPAQSSFLQAVPNTPLRVTAADEAMVVATSRIPPADTSASVKHEHEESSIGTDGEDAAEAMIMCNAAPRLQNSL